MSDYCVVCGDATPSDSEGEYIAFESECGIEIERYVCNECR